MIYNKKALYGNKYVNINNGILILDQLPVLDITKDHCTPLFIFLKNKIIENVNKIDRLISEVFPLSQGFYSLKANYIPKIVEIIKNRGFGAEIVGLPELNILKGMNFPPEKILAGGPYINREFIKNCLEYGINNFVVYHIEDLDLFRTELNKITRRFKINIILRIRSQKFTARHGIVLTYENINKLESFFKKNTNFKFLGILSHLGTPLKEEENFLANTKNIIDAIKLLEEVSNLRVEVVDFGGGFPSADSIKNRRFIKMLMGVKETIQLELQNRDLRFFYEPGRLIVEDAGFCLAKVYHVDKMTNTIFLNVGNNYIPKFMRASLRFYNVSRIIEHPNTPFDFMGPIPSDQDILIKKYNFIASTQKGDYILISNTGAYALTWSTHFPYKKPEILLLDGKEIEEIYFNF